ncbi:MAG: hypothetical protein KBH06_02120 [Spirochaetes bacterium]|nr:hypothetical protein [Spirochaetota bacterium]
MAKKLSSETITDENLTAITETAAHQEDDDKNLSELDVIGYELPADLLANSNFFTDEDLNFEMHLKRAHKFHSTNTLSKAAGLWTITAKGFNPEKNDYSILIFAKTENCPTAEDIFQSGFCGKFRLVLKYYNPYRTLTFKKNNKPQTFGGNCWITVSSKDFIIPEKRTEAPAQAATPQAAFQVPKFDMKAITDFQMTMDTINATANQAMALQMQALANRQQIVAEGVHLGRLEKELELTRKERDTFHQQTLDMQTLMQEIQNKQGGGMLDGLMNIARMLQTPESGSGDPSKG